MFNVILIHASPSVATPTRVTLTGSSNPTTPAASLSTPRPSPTPPSVPAPSMSLRSPFSGGWTPLRSPAVSLKSWRLLRPRLPAPAGPPSSRLSFTIFPTVTVLLLPPTVNWLVMPVSPGTSLSTSTSLPRSSPSTTTSALLPPLSPTHWPTWLPTWASRSVKMLR